VWSLLVLVLTFVFTIICYRNFGRGFAHFRASSQLGIHPWVLNVSFCAVHVDRTLAETGFEPEVFERKPDDVERAPLPFEPLSARNRPDTFVPSFSSEHYDDEKVGADADSVRAASAMPLPTYLRPFGQ
jgi:hypothetical protein